MQPIAVDDLISAIGGVPNGLPAGNPEVTRICIDSRQIQAGDVFWALEGNNFDGHEFVESALQQGALLAVVEPESCSLERTIQVADTLMAFWDFAEAYRRQFDSLIIGVTGTVGKTTTRHMIHSVLSNKFRGIESPQNFNNHFGVPLSLLQLDDRHDFGVIEIGASQPGEIGDLTEIVHPEIGVITAIGPCHLDEFKSFENILRTKAELIERIPKEGFVVLNGDDRNVRKIADNADCSVVFVGERSRNDLVAKDIRVSNNLVQFRVDQSEFHVPATGRHHVTSALISIAIGRQIDMTDSEIQNGLNSFSAMPGRSCLRKIGPWTVIDDTYNSNPVSMSAACRTLQDMTTEGKRILLTGDMLALGEWSEDFHHLLGEEVTRAKIDRVIAIGSQAASVAGSARQHGMDAGCLGIARDQEIAMMLLNLWLEPNDVVLVKGSRGTRMETFLPRLEQLAEEIPQMKTNFETSTRKVA
ncbi:UDP-N-acetylmuramoyl-tripeptide--D-alanyl-D-alanine ligase [Thalassoglobus sp. JC818]|uniref:UDP-N-acetylmuramoyl-tripeptide--D-alanyl-D- alanine ligase n=1 Tax=Thalassoglobus sp. JC818 TaxID=3232136 RepID=UPI0034578FB0